MLHNLYYRPSIYIYIKDFVELLKTIEMKFKVFVNKDNEFLIHYSNICIHSNMFLRIFLNCIKYLPQRDEMKDDSENT